VKDVCTDLQQRGLLDTWREPSTAGRPRLLYRVTERAHDLFPTASNPLTIEILHAAQKLFGPSAAEKLLLVAFQARAAEYTDKIRCDTLEGRAKRLTTLRDAEGCMANCEVHPGKIEIVERHSPILDVLQAFPKVATMEADLFQKVLGVPICRTEAIKSGLFCATFSMAAD
jgi:predicted ArsR family transcriptional regulator